MAKEIILFGDTQEGSTVVYRKNGVFLEKGLMLDNGSSVWFPRAEVGEFYDGLAVIDYGKRCGYLNRLGNIVILPKYISCENFSEGLAFATDVEKTFLINKTGHVIAAYDELLLPHPFSEGLAKISRLDENGESRIDGIINTDGKFIVEPRFVKKINSVFELFDDFDKYSNGLLRMPENDKYGFLDRNGDVAVPFIFDWATSFENGFAGFVVDESAGFIDRNCNMVIEPTYQDAAFFVDNMFFVKQNNKWGAINFDERVVVEFQFDSIGVYQEGLVPIRMNNKWGILDLQGDFNVEPRFDNPPIFRDGILKFVENKKSGVMNRNKEELVCEFIYEPSHMLN